MLDKFALSGILVAITTDSPLSGIFSECCLDIFLFHGLCLFLLIFTLCQQGFLIIWIRKLIVGRTCASITDLTGKTAIITGANSGIGKETARDFVRRGARVILACRDLSKGKRAADEIDIEGLGEVVVRHLDLTSLNSVRTFAKEILNTESQINILINNAGCMGPKIDTADGHDIIFSTNYLGHFLLTNLLLSKIKESAPARIVNLSALFHIIGKIHWDDLNISKSNGYYGVVKAYAQSKLAMLLFTNELARRLNGSQVNVYAVHPGLVSTGLLSSFPNFIQALARPVMVFAKNAVQGAQTTIQCAVSEDVADQSGLYYSNCKETKPARMALNAPSATRLWDMSMELHTMYSFDDLIGAKVILACRNLEKASETAKEIENSQGQVIIRHLDLNSFKSIDTFVNEVLNSEPRIDVLVNNAGVILSNKSFSKDGIDSCFQTNYLGHFLLTNLLLDRLKDSAPSRVINLSSLNHRRGVIHWDDINLNRHNSYNGFKAYNQSKLACVLFTKELALRLEGLTGLGTGVNVYAVDPGIASTEIVRFLPFRLLQVLAGFVMSILFKSATHAAQTTIYCAVSDEVSHESGLYYSDCKVEFPSTEAQNVEASKKLWKKFRVNRGASSKAKTPLTGKTIIVTGSNTGIGKETARDFVSKGARVILACRNLEKANEAAEDIKTAGAGEVVARRLDLSSFKSIHQFAKEILESEERIDILVNNAGVMSSKGRTEDDFDLVFGTNHLGPFLLTHLLLDKIKESAPARIVNVASELHRRASIDWDDINLDQPGKYGTLKAYSQSKLCNILFSNELARRLQGSGVNVYSLHPGVINSELHRNFSGIVGVLGGIVFPLFTKTVKQGAQTTIYCALSERVQNQSGLYYSDCAEKRTSALARDEEAAKKIWNISMHMCDRNCTSQALLTGKTVIVTGSNTGIGKEAARDFVKRGARVILACRNINKANEAAEDIKSAGPGEVVTRHLDLSSFKSIREFAQEINQSEARIDILVNNAGILVPKGKTEDNFDLTFGTNHLGPFLLTHLLLDKIKQSTPARIVNVSSRAHQGASINWDDINLNNPGNYGSWKAYTQSKLCNILFSKELASQLEGTGVNVYSLHPGLVNSSLFRNIPKFVKPFTSIVLPLVAINVVKGAQTTIHCAVSEEVQNESGLYYSDCAVTKPSALASDEIAAKKLWDISMKMCGLSRNPTGKKETNLLNWFSFGFNGKCTSLTLLTGKTIIITGSNAGIGKEAARDFVKRGARVILACRNLEKANEAADDIKTAGPGEVVTKHLDLSSFKSIRQFAQEIIESEERLDILVNNAGGIFLKEKTEDDIDLAFCTNHLGPFLLTHLLLDKIKQSAPARIVNVASTAHHGARIDWDDINLDNSGNYGLWKAYAQGKLCNVLFTKELASQLKDTGINVYCLHPGFVNTGLFQNFPFFIRSFAAILFPIIAKNLVQGAQTTIYCAVSEEVQNESGLFYRYEDKHVTYLPYLPSETTVDKYDNECAKRKPSAEARDRAAAKKLWDLSMRMCGLEQHMVVGVGHKFDVDRPFSCKSCVILVKARVQDQSRQKVNKNLFIIYLHSQLHSVIQLLRLNSTHNLIFNTAK
uniref:Dehydrogenase n=1 Tax=Strigamia maritima TaxID=126957 RepID=T1J5Y8_STRMM